ncbi:MAG: hypothetical protein EHM49_00235 [Deltaproteobacteria bacterium]|nr:MAG: hypothetical protein EHM49_00235 [Deltaproteobacteria bacterium]
MAYAHTSKVAKKEPSWGSVDKTKLPDSAFADSKNRKYPHHWISGGVMYLHRGGLAAARSAAGGARSGKKASTKVSSHINKHAKDIGMGEDKKKQQIDMETLNVGINALHIMDPEIHECLFKKEEGEGASYNFSMIGYSGGIIKNHWYWGNLAIDLAGFLFNKPKYPILRDHDTNREIGFSKKPAVEAGKGLVFTNKNATLLENEEAVKFVENAFKGFPYQASIYGKPLVIEKIAEGQSVKVNGLTLKGPGTVWRKTEYMECSICVFGYDDKTIAQVFSDNGQHLDMEVESIRTVEEQELTNDKMEVFGMDLEKLKEESPEEYEALMAEAKEAAAKELEDAFTSKLAGKDGEISSLAAEKETLTVTLQTTEARVLALEKKDVLREEEAMNFKAASIWKSELANSGLPEWLHAKVQKHVQRASFMGEDGGFNVEAFTEAVKAEIKDWGSHVSQEDVQGFSLLGRSVEGGSSHEKLDSDAMVDRMLGYVGQSHPDTTH